MEVMNRSLLSELLNQTIIAASRVLLETEDSSQVLTDTLVLSTSDGKQFEMLFR